MAAKPAANRVGVLSTWLTAWYGILPSASTAVVPGPNQCYGNRCHSTRTITRQNHNRTHWFPHHTLRTFQRGSRPTGVVVWKSWTLSLPKEISRFLLSSVYLFANGIWVLANFFSIMKNPWEGPTPSGKKYSPVVWALGSKRRIGRSLTHSWNLFLMKTPMRDSSDFCSPPDVLYKLCKRSFFANKRPFFEKFLSPSGKLWPQLNLTWVIAGINSVFSGWCPDSCQTTASLPEGSVADSSALVPSSSRCWDGRAFDDSDAAPRDDDCDFLSNNNLPSPHHHVFDDIYKPWPEHI